METNIGNFRECLSGVPIPELVNVLARPCPFCECDDPGDIVIENHDDGTKSCRVQCTGCNCEGPSGESPAEAALAWNGVYGTQRIGVIRGHVFEAQAIVDVVRLSINSSEDYSRHHALQSVYDKLDEIATALEFLGREFNALEDMKAGIEGENTPPDTQAQGDDENADAIRKFLASVRLLRGCSFGDEVERGRAAILQIAAATADPRASMPTATQCIDAIDFLSSLEPVSHSNCYACSGTETGSGHNLALEGIRDVLSKRLAQ